jgi:LmbE family N-acetylglucosaminyl deacetylase
MIRLLPNRLTQLLCLGAHADDIEIGAGGTVLKLLHDYPEATVHWIVFSAVGEREQEARQSAARFLERARAPNVIIQSFSDGFFPYQGQAIKQAFETLKRQIEPDLILTHSGLDAHQDHRLINELTWNTFRRHTIFEFEIPKYDGDLGRPNLYVPLPKEICYRKIQYLMATFLTQGSKHWFTEDAFWALLRLRGIECGESHAEAYYTRKLVL